MRFSLTGLACDANLAHEVGESGMKWHPVSTDIHVQRALSALDRPERALEHPGEVPGGARAIRRQSRRRTGRRMSGSASAAGMAAHGNEAARAVAVQRRG